ncbi:hypothetical protein XMD420_001089 [Marinobacterium sp. xm-d-420]|uniref:hypothetical protein n=1 Tax=Marinobacterium sp. xm-d-420 TaxID=2497737 RepID=UPI001568FCB0|nr:hypothetical protein [Marinobacterium sp. xm-d-420]NRP27485.1 hypothetical protein [Marinobacterium sp. xm-d-420]
MKNHLVVIGLCSSFLLTGCNYKATYQRDRGGDAVSYGSSNEIPERVFPNDATISDYEDRKQAFTQRLIGNGNAYIIEPKGNAVSFPEKPNPPSASLEQELAEGFFFSYLFYDSGVITYNGIAEAGRFSRDIDDKTLFFTHSTGKTIVSYIVGHAICGGYIDSVDEPIDWPMMKETLYQGQPLIHLLNMAAGDSHLVDKNSTRLRSGSKKHHRDMGHDTIAELLKGTVSSGNSVRYNNMLSDIIASYVAYKVGDDYDELLRSIFQDKVKIQNPILFELHRKSFTDGVFSPYYGQSQTRASYSFQTTRKDLLRIAIAIMEDYQNNTCVGQYLKEVQTRAQHWPKYNPNRDKDHFWLMNYARSYGGQAYWNFYGMQGRNILGTDGRNGQHFLIDFDNSRIVATNSASIGFDVRHFILNAIKDGKIPK